MILNLSYVSFNTFQSCSIAVCILCNMSQGYYKFDSLLARSYPKLGKTQIAAIGLLPMGFWDGFRHVKVSRGGLGGGGQGFGDGLW